MPVIEAKEISKTFWHSAYPVHALQEISISLEAGKFAIIKGPSGSGKTTLLSILGCLLSPSAGDIRIFDRWISQMNNSQRRMLRLQKIGFIFQTFNLLEALTARENVAIPHQLLGYPRKVSLEKADVLLREVGLDDRADFQIRDLSQGEKQRVAVARAFINEPEIILADEPTASVDSRIGREIIDLLKNLAATNKLVIVATHDERITHASDTVIFIDDGKLVDVESRPDAFEKTDLLIP